jgi:TonB family protein
MRKKLPAILTLLGAFLAVGVVLATDLADPVAAGVSAPYLIAGSRVTPLYPPAAYAAKYSGVVRLRATVNADGTVGTIEILDSTASNMGFEQAALDAVTQWQFEPARKGDSVVGSYTEIRLSFNPPTRNSRGFVASGFGNPSGGSLGSATSALPMRTPTADMSVATQFASSKNGTAWLPIEYQHIYHYGRPPGQLGAIYDRRDLIPPGTGGHQIRPESK